MTPPDLPDIPSSIVINDNVLVIETSPSGLYTFSLHTPSGVRGILTTYDYSDLVEAHQKEVSRLNSSSISRFMCPPETPQ